MTDPRQGDAIIARRSPEARLAYVDGYAAGWKQAMHEFAVVGRQRLDEALDFMSDVENNLREKEGSL